MGHVLSLERGMCSGVVKGAYLRVEILPLAAKYNPYPLT